MSATATSDRISPILGLVGPALLLPWPRGSKGGPSKWGHLQLSDMDNRSHLAKLAKAGNIGIALGRVSTGLVTIDLDEDNNVDAFLEANLLLRSTLRTHARRGCNIWVRCSGGYPAFRKLKNLSGDEIGEWRADGSQTIIAGTHPEGMPYKFVVESPVMTVSYEAIIWPESILPPHATESNRVRRVREHKVVSLSARTVYHMSIEAFITGDLITQVAPTDYHQNNDSLFKLGRVVRSCEGAIGRLATDAELELVFDRWCLSSRRFWREGHTRDDYYAEFLSAYSYARIGLDKDPIEVAMSRAKAKPLPQVGSFTDERIRLLAGICREMQGIMGTKPFYLPTRKLGDVLSAHWTSVALWLRVFEHPLEIIHLAPGEVRKRGGNRCPRYHCDIALPAVIRSGQCKAAVGLEADGHQCRDRLQFSDESTLAAAAAAGVQLNEAAKENQ